MINVLMIEDDPEFAQILSEYLSDFNIKVTNFEDPYLGLSAGIKNFDLLILDLTLIQHPYHHLLCSKRHQR